MYRYLPTFPFILFLLVFSLLGSSNCDGDSRNRRAARGENFVSDPDHLFFMNTRSRDYRSVTLEEGVDGYYHDDLPSSDEAVIVDRWIEDRAILVVQGKELSITETLSMRDSLQRLDREATLEVVEDYLRLVGR